MKKWPKFQIIYKNNIPSWMHYNDIMKYPWCFGLWRISLCSKKIEYDNDDDDDDCGQIFKFNSHTHTHTCRFYICFIFLPHWLLNTNTNTHNEKWKSFNLDGSRVYMIYKHFVSGCFFYRSQSIHSHIKYEKKLKSKILQFVR